MVTIRYTEWDGTQQLRLSADRVFEKLAEYLSCTDDVQQAFEWLLRHGLDVEEVHVIGLEELLDHVRGEMRARYERYNLDHAFDDLRRRLDELLDIERATLDDRGENDPAARAKRQQLDRVPNRLRDAIEYLRGYDFEDEEAANQFQDLLDELENTRALEEFQHRYRELFRGPEALGYDDALEVMEAIQRLKQLEDELLANDLERISAEELSSLLGAALGHQFGQLRQLVTLLDTSGYLGAEGGRMQLSPKGVRRIGQLALREIYQGLLRDRGGNHEIDHRGVSEVQPDVTKPYAFGDEFHLDLPRTLKNALTRACCKPLQLRPEDFAVHDTHHATTTSTVLLLDMSWSMSWEGRFAAAKKVAMAMESLIRSRYPHDYFGIVGFYTRATELKVRDLPEASWNMGDPFTNLQDGLRLASELLSRHPSNNRYMIVITDGQPTAYFSRGRLFCEWPLSFGGISMRAAQETLREVERVTRRGIVINTFMLDDSPSLRAFVERMTRVNKGRALFTRPARLGEYLLVDYIARKRKRV
jgi:uncharacterized protein with von Willebrand factor type A (vWA) domain